MYVIWLLLYYEGCSRSVFVLGWSTWLSLTPMAVVCLPVRQIWQLELLLDSENDVERWSRLLFIYLDAVAYLLSKPGANDLLVCCTDSQGEGGWCVEVQYWPGGAVVLMISTGRVSVWQRCAHTHKRVHTHTHTHTRAHTMSYHIHITHVCVHCSHTRKWPIREKTPHSDHSSASLL